ncbi:MAG TPA: hypothetical protein DEP45_04180 [Armatimonadetes bacterium]|nr:hypothetical protein [Armatimonadota bacterium]
MTIEQFANGRAAITERIYPSRPDSTGVRAAAAGSGAEIQRLEAWLMQDIWWRAAASAPVAEGDRRNPRILCAIA